MSREESNEQRKVIDYCNAHKIFIFSVPNGAMLKGNAKQRAIQMHSLKREGFLNGVSDLICMVDSKVLFIEMKKKKKVLKNGTLSSAGISISEFQKSFLEAVEQFDYACSKICYGADEAIKFINKHS